VIKFSIRGPWEAHFQRHHCQTQAISLHPYYTTTSTAHWEPLFLSFVFVACHFPRLLLSFTFSFGSGPYPLPLAVSLAYFALPCIFLPYIPYTVYPGAQQHKSRPTYITHCATFFLSFYSISFCMCDLCFACLFCVLHFAFSFVGCT